MSDKEKIPASLTLATDVLPPGQQEDISQIPLTELVGRINAANGQLRKVINESGNGVRFRETRDRLLRDVALGKKT